jgi:hypothetical protein
MQPGGTIQRPARMSPRHALIRLAMIVLLALASAAIPIGKVAACSCAGLGTPADVVAASDVTFIGTVIDTASGGPAEFGGSNIRYAFDVERASAATEAVLVVEALDDPGGASCGLVFGIGERWLVSAHLQGSELETNLCSGNRLADELPEAEAAAYAELLSEVPPEPAEPAEPSAGPDLSLPAAILVAVLGALVLGGVTFFAVRGPGRTPAR